jgi:hypothetical protein
MAPMMSARESSFLSRWLMRAGCVLASLALVACGGGGGAGAGGQGSTGSGSSATGPASLVLLTSAPTIGSDGRSTATISAVVKDAGNRTMLNQDVVFSTTDVGATLQVNSQRTDLSGTATATLSISEPANREIAVRAVTGSLESTIRVAVTGTQLAISGPANLVAGAPNEYTVSLRNSAGSPIVGRAVSIASAAGNSLSAGSVVTDSAGQARVQVTGSRSGADTITASSTLGASASLSVQVSGTLLSFLAPTASSEPQVSTAVPIRVRYLIDGVAQVGQTVTFLSTRGTVTSTNVTTDAAGEASTTLSSPTAGLATLTALAGSVSNTQRVEFVSRTASKISLQSSPASVGVNLSATGTNSSQLIAVVRDAADNPIKGATVSFSAIADPSNGRIEPATATTDSSGVASVAFFPGANSTGNRQIIVRAAVTASAISADTTLTASQQELVVRIGTGNQIETSEATRYIMPWTAAVTDSAGNPVVGAVVQASLVGVRFFKGRYFWTGAVWSTRGATSDVVPWACESEDTNGNLRLDPGEDRDGDGALEPANVAVVRVVSTDGRTDASGFANIQVEYPREYANWTQVRLRVTITAIAGTEVSSERTFSLPVLAADIGSETILPPGAASPFGVVGDCFVPN